MADNRREPSAAPGSYRSRLATRLRCDALAALSVPSPSGELVASGERLTGFGERPILNTGGSVMRLHSKVALITGAAQGIGAACARRFTQEGAAVMLIDLHQDKGSALARALGDEGCQAEFVRADVSSKSDVDAAVAATVARYG